MIAEANALDDLAVPYVEAGDNAFGKNGRNSSGEIRFSSIALPLITAANAKVYPYALDSGRSSFTVNSSEWMKHVLSDIYANLEDRRPEAKILSFPATFRP